MVEVEEVEEAWQLSCPMGGFDVVLVDVGGFRTGVDSLKQVGLSVLKRTLANKYNESTIRFKSFVTVV